MNIKALRIIANKKKYSIKELSQKISITEAGLHRALKKGDMKVSLLEKIAKVLEVPVGYFFDEVGSGSINNSGNIHNGNGNNVIYQKDTEIEYLKREIKLKDEIIELLKNKK